MQAGELRHRVTLERPVRTLNGAGETIVTWEFVDRVWAEVDQLKAWQVERAKQVQMNRTHLVKMRYRSDVTGDWRIKLGAAILNITGIVNTGNRNVELEISCEQEAA